MRCLKPYISNMQLALYLGVGAGIEYYDFAIFSLFAKEITLTFFPYKNEMYASIATYFFFFFGYLVRPLGGYIGGLIGDRYGRKVGFLSSAGVLVVATFGMGVLPGAAVGGMGATVLFIFFRCMQGLAVGGEIPLAMVLAVEHFPTRKGLAVGVIFAFLSLGILMTYVTYYGISFISIGQIAPWRVAFLLGALFSIAVYFLRKKIHESPLFQKKYPKIQKKNKIYVRLWVSIGLIAPVAMFTTYFLLFMPHYLSTFFAFDASLTHIMFIQGLGVMFFGCVLGGGVNDFWSKKWSYSLLLGVMLLAAYFFYHHLTINILMVRVCFGVICLGLGLLSSTYTVLVVNFFLPWQRCKFVGLAYNLAYTLFSAPVPMLSIALIHFFNEPMVPFILLAMSVMMGWGSMIWYKRLT